MIMNALDVTRHGRQSSVVELTAFSNHMCFEARKPQLGRQECELQREIVAADWGLRAPDMDWKPAREEASSRR